MKSAKLIVTIASILAIGLSGTLLFSTNVSATCTLTVQCPGPAGGTKSCSGSHCQTTGGGSCVTCTINGQVTPESGCCSGSDS